MRPSDITHSDLRESHVLPSGALELKVISPKEKRQGQAVMKSVFIHPHENPLLCPVAAFKSYSARLAGSMALLVKHPHLKSVKFLPIIRNLGNVNKTVGSDTISNHITKVSSRIVLPAGSSPPSGRSIGSCLTIEHGASIDEVQAQGFWAHSATFESLFSSSQNVEWTSGRPFDQWRAADWPTLNIKIVQECSLTLFSQLRHRILRIIQFESLPWGGA